VTCPDLSSAKTWKVEDGIVLLTAVNALLDQSLSAGKQPDDWSVSRLLGMSARLLPPGQAPAEAELAWGASPSIGRWEAIHDVATYRILLRDELQQLAKRLDAAGSTGPAGSTAQTILAIEHIRLFLQRLEVSLNIVLDEPRIGGVN